MLTRFFIAGLAALVPHLGTAQVVTDCDWRARADAIVEPWDLFTRTFANGDVRLALLDTVEPAAGALHLLVISPPFDTLGSRQCKVVSLDANTGFAGMQFEDLQASYDPARGLIFILDVQTYTPESADLDPAVLTVVVNQATGLITPRVARN